MPSKLYRLMIMPVILEKSNGRSLSFPKSIEEEFSIISWKEEAKPDIDRKCEQIGRTT